MTRRPPTTLAALALALAIATLAASPATRPADSRTYDCPRLPAAPTIDGDLSDPAWAAAPWSDDFVDLKTGDPPAHRTRAKLAWDDQFLYVAAELESPHVRATTDAKRDDMLYATDDVFELFLDPDGDARDYAEFQINAAGTVMDLLMDKPYVDRGWFDLAWNIDGLRSAVQVDGTLNNSVDDDRRWLVELAIPFASLGKLSPAAPLPPRPGQTWRIQLARAQHSPTLTPDGAYAPVTRKSSKPTYSAWSPQPERSLHAPHLYGTLRFVPK